jgi:hypothetical protein
MCLSPFGQPSKESLFIDPPKRCDTYYFGFTAGFALQKWNKA